MKPSIKYWIFLAVVYVVVFGVIFASIEGAWLSLNEAEQATLAKLFQKLLPFPLLGAFSLCLILGFMISQLFHYYIIPILKLGESTLLISAANPQHRIKIKKGAREVHYLTGIINDSADAFANLQRDVNEQIAAAQAKLNEERTRLAALMSEMPHGVLVCNTDGQILLYNQQTQQLFNTAKADENRLHGILGLGRSIFSILDRDPIVHALEWLHNSIDSGQSKPVSNFMMTLHNGVCLRVNMAPVYLEQNKTKSISGFVLTLQDMTRQIEADNRRDMLIQTLTDDLQGTLQVIRSSITTILNQPRLDYAQLTKYRRAINLASKNLQNKIEQARVNYARHLHDLSKTEDVLAANLLEVIQKNIHARSSIQVNVQASEGLWLKLDSYSMVQAISHLSGLLQGREQTPELLLTLTSNERQEAEFAIIWPEQDVDLELLQEWKRTPLLADNHGKMLTFLDVISQMGGSIKTLSYLEHCCSGILLTFPPVDATEHLAMQVLLEHRPVSYEFDLFNRTAWQELGQTPLEKLTYVVFDTETTGLNPSDGDEIIQLGAIRIVNGQLLPHESIDQLVDPQRHVPASSVAIHGIDPALLPGQPTIDKVLPHFHKFVENSVLVAHNAAFDMRFLQLQEEKTGIKFENPVLDTLLLSTIIHPHQDSHALEGLAERLNVTIVGRHTALGDAIVTAEVLLKMIPLLKANGIFTLEDAIKAAAKSPFAKVNY
jgi:DNA polymerase-3 subunit epsilon